MLTERLIMKLNDKEIIKVVLPTKYGKFDLYDYHLDGVDHLAIVKGNPSSAEVPLVRIHSECMTGDVFGSQRCDCGEQLASSMEKVEKEKCGIIIYLRQEGRGIGLFSKMKAYKLQENGMDTVEANIALGFESDCRNYDVAITLLKYFNIKKLRLITNNQEKIKALKDEGFDVVREESVVDYNEYNLRYMRTKKEKMGHILNLNKYCE